MMTKLLKPVCFVLFLVPFAALAWGAVNGTLGVNPVETLTHETGEWALRFLLLTLCATPVQRLFKVSWPIRIRRMLGLYTFFYASLHFITWLWLDRFFDIGEILIDIGKRPFVTVGFIAFLLLVPLAVTSNNAMIRKLGSRWRALHRLVYPIAVLVLLHYVWLVKADLLEPAIYLGILLVLLAWRLAMMLSATAVSTAKKRGAQGSPG